MTITDQDMRLYVVQSLGSVVAKYDINEIVDHLQGLYGTCDLSTVAPDAYWHIVSQHEKPNDDATVKAPTEKEEAQYRKHWERLWANSRYGKSAYSSDVLMNLLDTLLPSPEIRINRIIATDSDTALMLADIILAFIASRSPVTEETLRESMTRIYDRFEYDGPRMCAELTKLAAKFAELGNL